MRFIIIFINITVPFSANGDLYPSPGHIFNRPKNYRTRSFMAAFAPIRVNTAIRFFIIVGFSPFMSFEGLSPPSGHIFCLSVISDYRRPSL